MTVLRKYNDTLGNSTHIFVYEISLHEAFDYSTRKYIRQRISRCFR